MTSRHYVYSLPERIVRSVLGLSAGVARETSEVVLPESVRKTELYENVVGATLRFLIQKVGQVEGVYESSALPGDSLTRRAAGNAIDTVGFVVFHVSPVWVLAALADVCGLGRHLIPEIADALKAEGLLEPHVEFTSVDQILDGLERTSARVAATINAPPLNVAELRRDWAAILEQARTLQPAALPAQDTVKQLWTWLRTESTRQDRSVFETSSIIATSAVHALPGGARWLSASALVGTSKTTQLFSGVLLEHYRQALTEIQRVGYGPYAARQLRPYVEAAVGQFSPERRTLTERLLERELF